MLCPRCKTELRIRGCKTVVNPKTLEVAQVQELVCRNKACEDFGNVVKEIRHELEAVVEPGE